MRRLFLLGFALLLALVPVSARAAEVVLFHTNDAHARIMKGDDGGKTIGLAEMTAAVRKSRAGNEATLWLDAGDTFHGMPAVNVSRGVGMVALLNRAGLDAMTPGNHDYNYGAPRLLELARRARFPVLSANTVGRETGELLFKPYKIFRWGGIRVGVFGLTTPDTAGATRPSNVETVRFTDAVEAAWRMVAELRPQCDVIVALAHLGLNEHSSITSERLAQEAPGIDVIIDGHSHTALPEGLTVGDTLIAQTGWHGHFLGRVMLTVENGRVVGKEARLLDAEAVAQLAPEPDEGVLKALAALEKRNAALFGKVVARSSRRLTGDRSILRRQESELGNLCADAFRWRAGADLAISNGGGMRSDLPAGDVTRGDIMAIFPFGNNVMLAEIDGATIRRMLERSVSAYPNIFGGFLSVSGLTFSFDPDAPAGARVGEIHVNGAPLDESRVYTLASSDFQLAGGDGYDFLKDLTVLRQFGTCEEILADYLNEVGMEGIDLGRITMTAAQLREAA